MLAVVASHHSVWDISDSHCLIVVANYHEPLGPVQQAGLVRALQNRFQLCCTLYQLFLRIVAVGGFCMPTNECSKGRELLATGQLSNSSPTIITHIQHIGLYRGANFACLRSQTKGLLVYKSHRCLGTCLKTIVP